MTDETKRAMGQMSIGIADAIGKVVRRVSALEERLARITDLEMRLDVQAILIQDMEKRIEALEAEKEEVK